MASQNKNIIVRIQDWIASNAGQTFLNYAYSWGAAVVILGALFKLTHIAGANAMLFIGMGTEVFVFFISGFDRPAGLKSAGTLQQDEDNADACTPEQPVVAGGGAQPMVAGSGTIIIGGAPMSAAAAPVAPVAPVAEAQPIQPVQGMTYGPSAAPVQPAAAAPAPQIDMSLLAEAISASNAEFLEAARNACTPGMKEAAEAYVSELQTLTETLSRVSEQAERMTRDSIEMDNLNRTLTGINTIYEMQLKSISTQVGTIDQINEQTRKMARQIEELNAIYNRMIQALTVNMQHTPAGAVQ